MPILSGGSGSGGGTGAGSDGWVDASAATWTFASATTFTVPSDLTTTFTKGTYLKLTQSAAVKFFVVIGSSFAAGNTTVTVTGGSDYTLANAAISANFYSYMLNPRGWPVWFNYVPTATGLSGALTITTAQFMVQGTSFWVNLNVFGTSNATTFTVDSPITPAAGPDVVCAIAIQNSGVIQIGRVDSGTGTLRFGNGLGAAGNFTASGTKGAVSMFAFRF